MQWDRVITASAAIGTFVTAYVTYMTVQEMDKQRTSSFRPVINTSQVYVISSKFDPEHMDDLQWKRFDPEKVQVINLLPTPAFATLPRVAVPLQNIGFGTAKNFNIHWRYDEVKAIIAMNVCSKVKDLGLRFDYNDSFAFMYYKGDMKQIVMRAEGELSSIEYVLPVSIDKAPVYVDLPNSYVSLMSAYVYARFACPLMVPSSVPRLFADVEFEDIDGSPYSRSFEFDMVVQQTTGNADTFFASIGPAKAPPRE